MDFANVPIMTKLSLEISGMHCEACVEALREAFQRIEGVTIESIGIGSAVVAFDETKTSKPTLLSAACQAGPFKVSGFRTDTW